MSQGEAPTGGDTADFDAARTQLRAAVDAACEREPDWPRGAAAAIAAVLDLGASRPALMRALTVDVFDDGFLGAQRYRRLVESYAPRLAEGREESAAGEMLPSIIEEALIGALTQSVSEAVQTGREATLPGLAPELTEFVLTPYIGAAEAKRIARGSRRSSDS